MRRIISIPNHGTVTLHFNSQIARLAGGPSAVNNCVTLDAKNIHVSRDWITAHGLAHEFGHVRQARKRGWLYLPWVLSCYARQGYANSTPEKEADEFMLSHWQEFPSIGPPVPQGIV